MDTNYLRTATRPEHEATEATVPLMDPALTREQYVVALQGMWRAINSWDEWAGKSCPPALTALLQRRRRSGLLSADLEHMGARPDQPAVIDEAPWLSLKTPTAGEFEAMFLGAMYVIEGSTLGGQYIARHVEDILRLEAGRGDAYFRGYGENTGAMWKEFKETLSLVPEKYTGLVVESAKRMFAFFAAQMTDVPG